MRLDFDVPGGDGPFRVAVQIQWNRAGMLGLGFLDLSETDKSRLSQLLNVPR
jgi:hypothetical protein